MKFCAEKSSIRLVLPCPFRMIGNAVLPFNENKFTLLGKSANASVLSKFVNHLRK